MTKAAAKAPGKTVVKTRLARTSDAPRLADLSGQLGYPQTAAEILKAMKNQKAQRHSALFVAESSGAGVIGWTNVSIAHLLEVGTIAEINGLIVAEGHRSLGAGVLLLDAAEDWAHERGCPLIHVRSNVIRERAHKFYERQGYAHYKTQKAFRKPL